LVQASWGIYSDGTIKLGNVQPVIFLLGAEGFDSFNPGGIASHHIACRYLRYYCRIVPLKCFVRLNAFTKVYVWEIETVLSRE